MTPEHRQPEHQPRRTIDEAIGEVSLWGEAWTLRLAAELTTAPYRASAHTELVPLTGPQGTCTAVHGRPYILVPEFRATIAPSNPAEASDAIGRVTATTWDGLRMEPIGELQAWYYDADRLLVLWEAFLEDRFQTGEAPEDANLQALWQGAEAFLRRYFPQVARILTTADDPLYAPADYQRFLQHLGYTQISSSAFGKPVPTTG